jgi:hypothetical protein
VASLVASFFYACDCLVGHFDAMMRKTNGTGFMRSLRVLIILKCIKVHF